MNNAQAIMEAIRDANYHREGIRCLRLLRVDATFFHALLDDVERLCAAQRPSDVRDPHHVTNWTRPSGRVLQYSLLNATGRYDDFTSDHNLSCFGKRFRDASTYPALAAFVASFPDAVNFRINVLGPSAALAPHEEHSVVRTNLGTIGLRPRFHLPIVTNPNAELILDGDVYHLEAGSVFFVNHGCFHTARNAGSDPRTHLVWDLLLTRESFELMFGDGPGIPKGTSRLSAAERRLIPLRTERLGYIRRLPSPVAEDEAHDLAFFEPQ